MSTQAELDAIAAAGGDPEAAAAAALLLAQQEVNGGGEPDPNTPKPTVNDAREAIFAKARAARQAESGIDPESQAAHERVAGREPALTIAEQLEREVNGGADPGDGGGDARDAKNKVALTGKTHKLRVEGNEVEVDEALVLEAGTRTLQKESTADARLKTAAETLALANTRLAEANTAVENARRLPAQGADREGTNRPPTGADSRKAAAKSVTAQLQEAVFEGESERLESTVEGLLETQDKATTDRLSERLRTKANSYFATAFKDVAADPALLQRAVAMFKEKQAVDPDPASYHQIAHEVGMSLSTELLAARAAANPDPPAPVAREVSRAAVKARIPVMPANAGSTRVGDNTARTPARLTPAQIVHNMRVARGQVPRG